MLQDTKDAGDAEAGMTACVPSQFEGLRIAIPIAPAPTLWSSDARMIQAPPLAIVMEDYPIECDRGSYTDSEVISLDSARSTDSRAFASWVRETHEELAFKPVVADYYGLRYDQHSKTIQNMLGTYDSTAATALAHILPASYQHLDILGKEMVSPTTLHANPRAFLLLPKFVQSAYDLGQIAFVPGARNRITIKMMINEERDWYRGDRLHSVRALDGKELYLPRSADGRLPLLLQLKWAAVFQRTSCLQRRHDSTTHTSKLQEMEAMGAHMEKAQNQRTLRRMLAGSEYLDLALHSKTTEIWGPVGRLLPMDFEDIKNPSTECQRSTGSASGPESSAFSTIMLETEEQRALKIVVAQYYGLHYDSGSSTLQNMLGTYDPAAATALTHILPASYQHLDIFGREQESPTKLHANPRAFLLLPKFVLSAYDLGQIAFVPDARNRITIKIMVHEEEHWHRKSSLACVLPLEGKQLFLPKASEGRLPLLLQLKWAAVYQKSTALQRRRHDLPRTSILEELDAMAEYMRKAKNACSLARMLAGSEHLDVALHSKTAEIWGPVGRIMQMGLLD